MEHDFFRYFVIIIFVIGALRSLFKKRPTQQQIRKPQPPEQWSVGREAAPVYKPRVETDYEGDDAAVQREIAKMFGKEPPVVKPEVPAPPIQYSSPDTTAYAVTIPEGYQETKKETVSEMTQILEKKTKTEEAARRFRESIKEKLYHPESLKDYIVISEILGKPKAFE